MCADQPKPPTLDYVVVDVFTSSAFAGNPLAVVFGAEGLSDDQLAAIAVEFNLSETTFPVPLTPADAAAGADYRLRIFTPAGEIPFAGHPTLGTAWVLRERGLVPPGSRLQACGAGLIGVALPNDRDAPVELSAPARDAARRLSDAEVLEVCGLVGLDPDDVAGPAYVAGCGLSWLYLRVAPQAVSRARPGARRVDEAVVDRTGLADPLEGVDVYAVESGSSAGEPLLVSSRVFLPGFGIPEDPATGSAAVGLGLALVAAGLAAPDGPTSYEITQGVDMGRPSRLSGRVEAADGIGVRSSVAGQVVEVAAGRIRVP